MILPAQGQEFFLLFEWQIRQDQPVNADLLTSGDELLRPVGKDHVGIGHKDHGNGHVFAQIFHKIEDFICCGPRLQGPQVGFLDHRSFCRGVGKGNAQFNQVRAVLHGSPYRFACGFQVRITAGNKGNECLAVIKSICNLTHGDPPLCSGR